MRFILALALLMAPAAALFSVTDPAVVANHAAPGVRFTENLGQWNKQLLYRAQLPGGQLYVEPGCLTFNFYNRQKLHSLHTGGYANGLYSDMFVNGHAYKVHFENANPSPQNVPSQVNTDYENFFIGNDPSKWKGGVHNYNKVLLQNIYDGIDYELLASGVRVKYNFHVKAGADPSRIRLYYEGVDAIRLFQGKLYIRTTVNEVVENRPYAYQVIGGKAVEVPCNYKLADNRVSFHFPKGYDKAYPLVIDPVLIFSAQIGSVADNFGMTATFDVSGNLYSGGVVYDPGYPLSLGAWDGTMSGTNGPTTYGNTDGFITKYNASGTALLYSTYLGGVGTEVVSSLIVNDQNQLCVFGITGAANFPVTAGASDPTFNGGTNIGFINNALIFWNGCDIFVTKINANGTALIASTYFGGSGNDGINYLANTVINNQVGASINTCPYDSLLSNYGDQFRGEIQLDSLGNIYICGSTRSPNLPIVNGFDNTLGGRQDAVVVKFNPSLSTILMSTYLGGSHQDCGNGLYVTPALEIYIAGGTCSNDFPGTAGGHGPNYKGGKTDGFVSRLSGSGSMMQSTYIGTASYDNVFFVQCDRYGSAYVYGQSLGSFTVQAFQNLPLFTNPGTHQFVAEFDLGLGALHMSTVFGSKLSGIDISPSAFAVDECNGNLYLSGWGGGILTNTAAMSGMPILNPTQATTTGFDFYLMALKPHASSLLYGSYFGGTLSREHVDGGTSRFDRKGVIYQSICAGCGQNQDFPISPGAWPCPGQPNCPTPNQSGNCNNGVLKINYDLQQPKAAIVTNATTGCVPLTVTLTNTSPGTSFKWYLGNGQTNTTSSSPVVTYTDAGTYTVSLLVMDTTLCIKKDSTVTFFTVRPRPSANMVATPVPCTRSVNLSYAAPGGTVTWSYGDGSPTTSFVPAYTYTADGLYTILMTVTDQFGCQNSVSHTVAAMEFFPQAAGNGTLCHGASFLLQAYGGTSYNWSPAEGLSSTTAPAPLASPTVNTIYAVEIMNTSFGQTCSKTITMELVVRPTPTTNFSYSVHPCGGMAFFEDKSVADIISWEWEFGSTGTSTVAHPYHFFPTSGSHKVKLTTRNTYSCVSAKEDIVTLITKPVSASGPTNVCRGQSAHISASGGIQYEWLPDDYLSDAFISNPVATPPLSTNYSVIITTAEANSVTSLPCEYTLSVPVKVTVLTENAVVGAKATPEIILRGEQTTLVYTGDPGAIVSWYPLGSTTPGFGYTVSATPNAPTTYTARISKEACGAVTTVFVDVRAETCVAGEIFIPNTFTPNGDGENDLLRVRGISVDEMYFAVYNRWGERMFETSDKSIGWDGRYEGRDADVGVFGWYLKVKCYNGEETFRKGNVTLIR
jgi:gliding motility-associated-like protein